MSFEMEVRAQRMIKKGEEITTRYLGPWEGQPARQMKIEKNWKFICDCLRCRDPTDMATYFSAVKCHKCPRKLSADKCIETGSTDITCDDILPNSGYLLPIDLQMLGTPWKCNACGHIRSFREIEDILILLVARSMIALIKNNFLSQT